MTHLCFREICLYQFYTGATAIEQEWRKRYPNVPPPPLRTIGQILKDLGLSKPRKRDRNKGAARYLCYPEHTIYHLLGGRVLESDFIGKLNLKQEKLLIWFEKELKPKIIKKLSFKINPRSKEKIQNLLKN